MDHLRPAPPKATKTHKPKVFVADGKEIPLRGTCLLFTKVADANTVITEQNMTKVCELMKNNDIVSLPEQLVY